MNVIPMRAVLRLRPDYEEKLRSAMVTLISDAVDEFGVEPERVIGSIDAIIAARYLPDKERLAPFGPPPDNEGDRL